MISVKRVVTPACSPGDCVELIPELIESQSATDECPRSLGFYSPGAVAWVIGIVFIPVQAVVATKMWGMSCEVEGDVFERFLTGSILLKVLQATHIAEVELREMTVDFLEQRSDFFTDLRSSECQRPKGRKARVRRCLCPWVLWFLEDIVKSKFVDTEPELCW